MWDSIKAGRHREAGVRVSSADWFKAGIARQRVGPPPSSQEHVLCRHETQAHSPTSQLKSLPCDSLRPHAGCRVAPSGCNACAAPRSSADIMIDSPEDYCGCHHVCRGIWGEVRHPLFFWLVRQHIPGGLCTLHLPPRSCLHARGGVTSANVTAGCCSHLP